MNKKVKVLLVILTVILVAWISIFVIDFVRFKNHQRPMFIFHTDHHDYKDGYVVEYKCLGYKYFEYRRDKLDEENLAPFWASCREE
jgi:hypothetical protein